MIKTIKNVLKQDKEKISIPRSIQDTIPVKKIYKDGLFEHNKEKFSKTYRFTDINYSVASRDDKEAMFLQYSELLNSLDPGATSKLTILNRKINKNDFEKNVIMSLNNDSLDIYRKEYNKIITDKGLANNSTIQEKFITISINKKNVEEARNYFSRISSDLISHFQSLGSECKELNCEERLRLIHDFFRIGEENIFTWDLKDNIKKGHSFKDYICPDNLSFDNNMFTMGDKVGRVFYLKDYASYIKDDMIAELTDFNKHMMLSIDIVPIPMDEAIKEVENRRLGVETNITNWQRRQNSNNNFSAVIPYDLEQQRKESKEFLDDLTTRDQRMFVCVLTIVIVADNIDQLDQFTESVLSIARKRLCQISILKYQQLDGLNTVLPYGVRKINALRTLTTESLAVFMPFRVQEINQKDGIYYGENVISKNMIVANRKELLNGNSFILGTSGSGKSFTAKNEIVSLALRDPNADILIIDPEREYAKLVESMGGENIIISSTSKNHINALDINKEYADGTNPIILKSEFILTLCDLAMNGHKLGPIEKSIIDRCTTNVYRLFQQGNCQGIPPTLQDFKDELNRQPEPEAKQISLALELFVTGSLNTFSKDTNVNTKSRIINYDILDLGQELKAMGMLVVLDSILNRITSNRFKGRNTYIFIDEIYLLFKNEYASNFLFTLWKRVRKYGAFCTGITQNVEDLLQSHMARTMLSNSEFIVMLNQSGTDRIELAKLLNISETQLSYITNSKVGKGLLKIGNSLVPFINEFPEDTKLYKLMSTKPGEKNL